MSGRTIGWWGRRGLLAGEQTIRGVTRPVTLEAVHLGHVGGPRGGQRAVFTADGTLEGEGWGLAWNVPPAAARCWSPKTSAPEPAPARWSGRGRSPACLWLPQRRPRLARRCDRSFSEPLANPQQTLR